MFRSKVKKLFKSVVCAVAVVFCMAALSGCGASKVSVSDAMARAKQVNTAISSALTQAAIGNESFGTCETSASISFGDVSNGSYSLKWEGVSDHPTMDIAAYLGSDFDGYAYVEFDPAKYTVNFALWSPKPIPEKYRHQLSADEMNQSKKAARSLAAINKNGGMKKCSVQNAEMR